MRLGTDGWLVQEPGDPRVLIVPSPRHSPQPGPPEGVCWHWTGPVSDVGALVRRVAKPVPTGGRAASWHLLIGRDGTVYQSVPWSRASWHAGDRWANGWLIGVEMENWGRVRRVLGRWLAWPAVRLPRAPVQASDGRWYDAYTPEQVRSAVAVLAAGIERYGWRREHLDDGHSEFAPGRKEDPGPVWRGHLPAIIEAAYAAATEA